jgi:hypothetical protein
MRGLNGGDSAANVDLENGPSAAISRLFPSLSSQIPQQQKIHTSSFVYDSSRESRRWSRTRTTATAYNLSTFICLSIELLMFWFAPVAASCVERRGSSATGNPGGGLRGRGRGHRCDPQPLSPSFVYTGLVIGIGWTGPYRLPNLAGETLGEAMERIHRPSRESRSVTAMK